MAESTVGSDKALGVGLVLSILAVIGAFVMYGGATQLSKAWGFALALVAAMLSVIAFQALE